MTSTTHVFILGTDSPQVNQGALRIFDVLFIVCIVLLLIAPSFGAQAGPLMYILIGIGSLLPLAVGASIALRPRAALGLNMSGWWRQQRELLGHGVASLSRVNISAVISYFVEFAQL